MIPAVNLNEDRDPRRIARKFWGDDLPEWVRVLAEEVNRATQSAVAQRLGYKGGSIVSQVLRAKYPGDLDKVHAAVRGAFMGEMVYCQGYGMEIGRDQCLREQSMKRVATSAARCRLYAACRNHCPHSHIREADDGE